MAQSMQGQMRNLQRKEIEGKKKKKISHPLQRKDLDKVKWAIFFVVWALGIWSGNDKLLVTVLKCCYERECGIWVDIFPHIKIG